MYNFFANVGNIKFEMFGPVHISLIALLLIGIFLIYCYREKLRSLKYKENIRYILGTILLLNMIVYYVGMFATNTFNIYEDLPLHLCFVTNFFMIYILFKGDRKLYKIIYFFTFIGPLPAVVWTDLKYAFDTCEFWQFIICHHFMILTSIYLLVVLRYKVEAKKMIPAFLIGITYVSIITYGNSIFHTNYIMSTSLPDTILKIYPFLRYIPPLIPLYFVGVLAFLASYLPAYFINKLDEKKEINENILDVNHKVA